MLYIGLFSAICAIPFLYCLFSLFYLLLNIFISRTHKLTNNLTMNVEESIEPLDHKPAIIGYLMNSQKVGYKEVFSTLFDFINRKIIEFKLSAGSDTDSSKYELKRNLNSKEELNEYESFLLFWMFKSEKETITLKDLKDRLYNDRMSKENYKWFQKKIQNEAIKEDFFDKKFSSIKNKMFFFTDLFVRITDIFMWVGIVFAVFIAFHVIRKTSDIKEFYFSLILVVVLFILKYLIKYLYSAIVYYNVFSKKGKEEYKKAMSFKLYLENFSTISSHSIMGYQIWGSYYVYSIEFGCSEQFYKQLKEMKLAKNSIDNKIFEFFEFAYNNIKEIFEEGVKDIIVDPDGESHVDYM